MKFNLKKPCANCPFRHTPRFYLAKGRAEEIVQSLTDGSFSTFPCHKTLIYGDDGEGRRTKKTQHCAGALIMLEHMGISSQMMRIAERLGMYDRRGLDMKAPVFKTSAAMIAASVEGRPSFSRRGEASGHNVRSVGRLAAQAADIKRQSGELHRAKPRLAKRTLRK